MTSTPFSVWCVFGATVAVALALDLLGHRRRDRANPHAVAWCVAWVGLGLAFGAFIWIALGAPQAQEYLAAYLIEKSLSVDNLFLFLLIFQTLHIRRKNQRRVLMYGILGALVFRGLFVALGVAALERWEWMTYLFGGILAWTALHVVRDEGAGAGGRRLVRWLSNYLPVTEDSLDGRFVGRQRKRAVMTPLLLAVVALELCDVMFALDSVPAALSITRDPFLVYAANAFAILGLRALYVVLIDLLRKLEYLSYGVAAVIAFAAAKMLLHGRVEVPPAVSTAVILGVLGVTVAASLRHGSSGAARETHG